MKTSTPGRNRPVQPSTAARKLPVMRIKGDVLGFKAPAFVLAFVDFCARRKVTRKEVHEATGIGPSTITGWLHGADPTLSNAQRVADFFGIRVSSLLAIGEELEDAERERQAREQGNDKARKRAGQSLREDVARKFDILQAHYPEAFRELKTELTMEILNMVQREAENLKPKPRGRKNV